MFNILIDFMNLEFIVFFVSSIFIYNGYSQGFLKQISFLFAQLIAFIFTKLYYDIIHNYLVNKNIIARHGSFFLKFILIMSIIFFCIKFCIRFLEQCLKIIGLNFTNRFIGAFLGFLQSVFILSLIIFILVQLNIISYPKKTISFSYFYMLYELGSLLIKNLY